MAKRVIFIPEAEQDTNNGYVWYESRTIGLGRGFLIAVDACIQAISRNPKLYQTIYQEYRRGIIRRFPYSIIYEETDEAIIIYAVFDSRRAPDQWRDRVQ